ncbi:MAG: RING finger protein [Oscillospiraceae bacterium]
MAHLPGECPVCKQSFKENDDIVFCPECGTPYHRACYVAQGQCLYAQKHGTGYEYTPPKQEPAASAPPPPAGKAESGGNTVVCPSCSTVNSARNIFCEQCGAPLHAPGFAENNWQKAGMGGFAMAGPFVDMAGEIDGIPKADWVRFFGPSGNNYLLRLAQQEERRSNMSFILSAFFFGPLYFAYRKMWGWAALYFVLMLVFTVPSLLAIMKMGGNPLVAGLTEGTINLLSQIVWFLNLALRLAASMFSMYLYRAAGAKKIKALRKALPQNEQYQEALGKKGGISVLGVAAVVAGLFLFSAFIYPLVGADMLTYLNSMM